MITIVGAVRVNLRDPGPPPEMFAEHAEGGSLYQPYVTVWVTDRLVYLKYVGRPKPDYGQQYLDLFVPLSHPVAVASRPIKQGVVMRNTSTPGDN